MKRTLLLEIVRLSLRMSGRLLAPYGPIKSLHNFTQPQLMSCLVFTKRPPAAPALSHPHRPPRRMPHPDLATMKMPLKRSHSRARSVERSKST